jgi:4-aminobutyrate aminotransferase-like enzyme
VNVGEFLRAARLATITLVSPVGNSQLEGKPVPNFRHISPQRAAISSIAGHFEKLGAHTGTFRGNQLTFAAGVETVRLINRDDVLGNVQRRGEQLAARLAVLRRHPWIRDVRGLGLMWGIELANPRFGQAAATLASTVQSRALHNRRLGGSDRAWSR